MVGTVGASLCVTPRTATEDDDYMLEQATIEFMDGESRAVFQLTVINDSLQEDNEVDEKLGFNTFCCISFLYCHSTVNIDT